MDDYLKGEFGCQSNYAKVLSRASDRFIVQSKLHFIKLYLRPLRPQTPKGTPSDRPAGCRTLPRAPGHRSTMMQPPPPRHVPPALVRLLAVAVRFDVSSQLRTASQTRSSPEKPKGGVTVPRASATFTFLSCWLATPCHRRGLPLLMHSNPLGGDQQAGVSPPCHASRTMPVTAPTAHASHGRTVAQGLCPCLSVCTEIINMNVCGNAGSKPRARSMRSWLGVIRTWIW